jgi:hypothetical protein
MESVDLSIAAPGFVPWPERPRLASGLYATSGKEALAFTLACKKRMDDIRVMKRDGSGLIATGFIDKATCRHCGIGPKYCDRAGRALPEDKPLPAEAFLVSPGHMKIMALRKDESGQFTKEVPLCPYHGLPEASLPSMTIAKRREVQAKIAVFCQICGSKHGSERSERAHV